MKQILLVSTIAMGLIFRPYAVNAQDFWQQTDGPCGVLVGVLAASPTGHIFAGTWNGIFRSADNGDNWMPCNNGLTRTATCALVINNSGHVFAGTGSGIFRSTDNGEQWTEVNDGLTVFSIHAFAISNDGSIFTGTDSGVFRSTNNGNSWMR